MGLNEAWWLGFSYGMLAGCVLTGLVMVAGAFGRAFHRRWRERGGWSEIRARIAENVRQDGS